jgi:hypothetical protein
MPVLDIDLDNVETTDRTIKALMFYPDAPEKRQQYFDLYQGISVTRRQLPARGDDLADALVPASNALGYLHARTRSETTMRLERGKIAGGILVLIKQLKDHVGAESANKAVYILQRWVKDAGMVSEVSVLESEIWAYWTQFKPVAHLWAVFYLSACGGIPNGRSSYSSLEALLAFLARAESFRHFGVMHYTKRSRFPVLPPNEMWTVPDDVSLPDIEVNVPPLTEEQQAILATYHHKTSR